MLHACCQERHFRTPAAHSVNAAERPSVYLCVHPPIPTCAECNTDLQITNVHAHLHTHKETHANMSPGTFKPLKNKLTDAGVRVHTHTHTRGQANKHSLAHTHTHVYAFTITRLTVDRLCTVVLGA